MALSDRAEEILARQLGNGRAVEFRAALDEAYNFGGTDVLNARGRLLASILFGRTRGEEFAAISDAAGYPTGSRVEQLLLHVFGDSDGPELYDAVDTAYGTPPSPDAPEGLTLSAYAPSPRFGITVDWSAPSGGVTPDGYEVRISDSDGGFETATVAFTDLEDTDAQDLLELSIETEYFVYVAAYVLDGATKVYGTAAQDSLTTAANDPPTFTVPATDPTEIEIEEGTLSISDLEASDLEGDGITFAVVSVTPTNSGVIIANNHPATSQLYSSEGDALPEGFYDIIVRAEDEFGATTDIAFEVTVVPPA